MRSDIRHHLYPFTTIYKKDRLFNKSVYLAISTSRNLLNKHLHFLQRYQNGCRPCLLYTSNFDDLNVLKETILSEGHAGMTEFSTAADDADDDI